MKPTIKEKLLIEIEGVLHPFKIGKILNWTTDIRTKQIVSECLWFLSLIKYSNLDIVEIKRMRDETGIAYS